MRARSYDQRRARISLESLARSHTEHALNVLVGILGNEQTPAAVRVKAIELLFDRGWGKATERHSITDAQGQRLMRIVHEIVHTNQLPEEDDAPLLIEGNANGNGHAEN
jgi:hypothetical protein